MKDKDRIKCYAEMYLNFVPEATSSQIAAFLRKGSFKFHGGNPSKNKVASILTGSSRFLSNKYSDGLLYFRLAEES